MYQFIAKIIIGLIPMFSFAQQTDFLTAQKKYERVRIALNEKQEVLKQKLDKYNLSVNDLNLIFVAYKDDDLLEIYGKSKKEHTYRKILSYRICSRSGGLGPKRKQGDGQVPEGFYHIDRFNPSSNFYLSLGINYPNLSDKRKSKANDLGGDIFIHGACVTIGCLPMTNNYIKEIYLLAIYAQNKGQSKIPVYLFPFKMTNENMRVYEAKYKNNQELISFWNNLKKGYDTFFKKLKALDIQVTKNGDYSF